MSDPFDIRTNDTGKRVRFQRTKQPITRFLAKITVRYLLLSDNDSDVPCWKFTGAVDAAGYGRFKADGENFAHRFSYQFFVGDIPEGYHVDHLCGWRTCVNPLHLEAVPPSENLRRRDENRTHCVNGHAFTDENTHQSINGRVCKTCRYERVKAWRERHPEQARQIGTESKRTWRRVQAEAGRTGRF